ncbi:hypothetical protein ASPWEDRAFT_31695 [Aspergillus wentii DTO 134E9]|uniref:tRNA pseudouridine synthase 1 n=1 Tax=Aspergillus wentii DTO 134E9 TaxID=1073089 RepID=A0A1L9R7X5_ASPWE|nr:uncharacterized protein ASPWEDRAFT_31695 [Aspergillus wentii DTO 134E9]OJJ31009.1 hypothetical protein ASPWEDRAFT_31695 [Aspergillus wentii DTO 134E9]
MDNNEERAAGEGADNQRKKRNLGRSEWSRQNLDKRARNEELKEAKRRKIEEGQEVSEPIYATHFSQEDIESEQRRPKKKVAVLLGYSGTGYHGMQLCDKQTISTIEGELFAAFVAAGAISKANAADPKKSSLVRCARTDKGVHAAGNIVSLKMIVEDPDVVQKINEKLSSQIRIWDIQVTNKGFSCYQMCDSRVYEYLIPSHCFVPPHPSTYLGRKIVELAEKEGDLEQFKARQKEVATYWSDVDEQYIKPILDNVPEDIRKLVQKALYLGEEQGESLEEDEPQESEKPTESAAAPAGDGATASEEKPAETEQPTKVDWRESLPEDQRREMYETIKAIKAAYLKAKRTYRIPAARLARVQEGLDKYIGTKNFFNYTIQKMHNDPSAKRHIKSFKVHPTPIIINGTEWLSMKVHGQSFMMHQIRKMVAMMTMVVRCGCDPERIVETYGATKIAIPKAPGLGLLLERPVFETFNKKVSTLGKKPIDFDNYKKEIDEFKQREIYDRIFREEEETNAFSSFFNHIDNFPQEEFLFVTSGGIPAAKPTTQPTTPPREQSRRASAQKGRISQREALATVESESEDERIPDNGEEGG